VLSLLKAVLQNCSFESFSVSLKVCVGEAIKAN